MSKHLSGEPHPVAFTSHDQMDNLCEPEQILPSQWRSFLTSVDKPPEWNLLFKVGVQSFRDYCLLPRNPGGTGVEGFKKTISERITAIRENVRWWIEDPNPESPTWAFSFSFFCEHILPGMDIERARKEALAFLDSQDKSVDSMFGATGQQLKTRIILPRSRPVTSNIALSGREGKGTTIMNTGTKVGREILHHKPHVLAEYRRRKERRRKHKKIEL